MIDEVQLKQSNVVGDEVILEDIYPKTSSSSVKNNSTGEPLDQTLDKLWNAINNKLSRIVNSINGKTGVVVLTADDVGLGNVDNVSNAELKQWVLQKISEAFENKRINLLNDENALLTLLATNNMDYKDSAFYIKSLNSSDTRGYIGYIYANENSSVLSYESMPINTIGSHDKAIKYEDGNIGVHISSYEDALKVLNTYTSDQYNGLYIDKSKVMGRLLYFEGLYGDTGLGTLEDNALLRLSNETSTTYPVCYIKINNTTLTPETNPFRLCKTDIRIGDIIITSFKEYLTDIEERYLLSQFERGSSYIDEQGSDYEVGDKLQIKDDTTGSYVKFKIASIDENSVYIIEIIESYASSASTILTGTFDCEYIEGHSGSGTGMRISLYEEDWVPYRKLSKPNISPLLTRYNSAIGIVTSAPTLQDPLKSFEISFYTIQVEPGYGLTNQQLNSEIPDRKDKLSIQLPHGESPVGFSSFSGLDCIRDWNDYGIYLNRFPGSVIKDVIYSDKKTGVMTPFGFHNFITTPDKSNGGLRIMTDMSLCIQSFNDYHDNTLKSQNKRSGSLLVGNWSAPFANIDNPNSHDDLIQHNLTSTLEQQDVSYLGINLAKIVNMYDSGHMEYSFINMSGLRIISHPNDTFDPSLVNIDSDDANTINGIPVIDVYLVDNHTIYGYLKKQSTDIIDESLELKLDVFYRIAKISPEYSEEDTWHVDEYLQYDDYAETIDPTKRLNNLGTLNDIKKNFNNKPLSGGLCVNVGKFLNISPGPGFDVINDDYYNFGKVNVNVGDGLKDNGHNKLIIDIGNNEDYANALSYDNSITGTGHTQPIGVFLNPNSGLTTSTSGGVKSLSINTGNYLRVEDNKLHVNVANYKGIATFIEDGNKYIGIRHTISANHNGLCHNDDILTMTPDGMLKGHINILKGLIYRGDLTGSYGYGGLTSYATINGGTAWDSSVIIDRGSGYEVGDTITIHDDDHCWSGNVDTTLEILSVDENGGVLTVSTPSSYGWYHDIFANISGKNLVYESTDNPHATHYSGITTSGNGHDLKIQLAFSHNFTIHDIGGLEINASGNAIGFKSDKTEPKCSLNSSIQVYTVGNTYYPGDTLIVLNESNTYICATQTEFTATSVETDCGSTNESNARIIVTLNATGSIPS